MRTLYLCNGSHFEDIMYQGRYTCSLGRGWVDMPSFAALQLLCTAYNLGTLLGTPHLHVALEACSVTRFDGLDFNNPPSHITVKLLCLQKLYISLLHIAGPKADSSCY